MAVLLTAKSRVEKVIKSLCDEGYELGPAAGPELELREGQPIIVRFRGNISDSEGRPVKLFYPLKYFV